LFPFGFGLGYTTFALQLASVTGDVDDGVTVTVDVTNTGHRPGGEVVQVYVAPPAGDAARPIRHLGGFARIDLGPGEQGRVAVELDRRLFESWLDGRWVVQPGEYTVLVGRSSRDLQPAGKVRAG
jgi:beta-glucosidase